MAKIISDHRQQEVELLVLLLKFSTLINRPMQDGVAVPEKLSLNELRVLMSVGGEGEIAGHDLAEKIAMPAMNVSRALAALQSRDWLEQGQNPKNKRVKPYHLSAKGKAAHEAMTPEVANVASFLFSDFEDSERHTLKALVTKLIARTEQW
jgi:DNA-binding MarR family transcriptional regulator